MAERERFESDPEISVWRFAEAALEAEKARTVEKYNRRLAEVKEAIRTREQELASMDRTAAEKGKAAGTVEEPTKSVGGDAPATTATAPAASSRRRGRRG